MAAEPVRSGERAGVPADIGDVLRAATRIGLIGHVTPDADCLCALAALAGGLAQFGKSCSIALPANSVSRKMAGIARRAAIRAATAAELMASDLLVVVDTAKAARANVDGGLEALAGIPIVNIDHHETNPGFGRWNWVVGDASSSCELVYFVLRALGSDITPQLATLLYAGIHSDTQGFSLPNTTPSSLQVGFETARAGAAIAEVCEQLHRSFSRGEFEVLRAVYRNTTVSADGRLAWSALSHEEIVGNGCTASDIDDQVEVVRSIAGLRIAILFSAGVPGKTRMNFRGEGGVSALALAQKFNGGGHHGAAGAIIDGPLTAVMEQVLPVAQAYVAELPG